MARKNHLKRKRPSCTEIGRYRGNDPFTRPLPFSARVHPQSSTNRLAYWQQEYYYNDQVVEGRLYYAQPFDGCLRDGRLFQTEGAFRPSPILYQIPVYPLIVQYNNVLYYCNNEFLEMLNLNYGLHNWQIQWFQAEGGAGLQPVMLPVQASSEPSTDHQPSTDPVVTCAFCTLQVRVDLSALTQQSGLITFLIKNRYPSIVWKCDDCQKKEDMSYTQIEQLVLSMQMQMNLLTAKIDEMAQTQQQLAMDWRRGQEMLLRQLRSSNDPTTPIETIGVHRTVNNLRLGSNPGSAGSALAVRMAPGVLIAEDAENSMPGEGALNSTAMSSGGRARSRALQPINRDFTPILSTPSNTQHRLMETPDSVCSPLNKPNDLYQFYEEDPRSGSGLYPYPNNQSMHNRPASAECSGIPQLNPESAHSQKSRSCDNRPSLLGDAPTSPMHKPNAALCVVPFEFHEDIPTEEQHSSFEYTDEPHVTMHFRPPIAQPLLSDIRLAHTLPDIPCAPLPRKEYILCILSHIESPSEFYVHLSDEEVNNAIDDLSEQLSSIYVQREYPLSDWSDAALSLLPGRCLVAFYQADANFYRVRVLKVQLPERTASVQYVDYGNTEQIPLDDLNFLRADLADMPALAIRCSLAYVAPAASAGQPRTSLSMGSNDPVLPQNWSDEQIFAFQSVSGYEREQVLTAHVQHFMELPHRQLEVLLWNNSALGQDERYNGDVLVNLWLCREGYAFSDRLEWLEETERNDGSTAEAEIQEDSSVEFHPLQFCNTVPPNTVLDPPEYFNREIVHPLIARFGESRMSELLKDLCKNFLIESHCLNESSCAKQHVYLEELVDELDLDPPNFDISEGNSLQTGLTVFMKITFVESPYAFYGVLPFGNTSCDVINVDTEKQLMGKLKEAVEFQKYKQMANRMKQVYENPENRHTLQTTSHELNLVVVQEDSNFFRARVIRILEEGNLFELRLVDSGRLITAVPQNVYRLMPEFMILPQFAISCRLVNVQPVSPVNSREVNWSEQAKNAFCEYTLDNIFLANIVQVLGDRIQVELLNIFEDQENVDEHLVNLGLATKVRRSSPSSSTNQVADATAGGDETDATEDGQETALID